MLCFFINIRLWLSYIAYIKIQTDFKSFIYFVTLINEIVHIELNDKKLRPFYLVFSIIKSLSTFLCIFSPFLHFMTDEVSELSSQLVFCGSDIVISMTGREHAPQMIKPQMLQTNPFLHHFLVYKSLIYTYIIYYTYNKIFPF